MPSVLVLHGPNINLLGTRESGTHGLQKIQDINSTLIAIGIELGLEVRTAQSNHQGELIDLLHEARNWAAGVVFNPAGYAQTSVAFRDAITAIAIPVIEVHLANTHSKEDFRHKSLIAAVCPGSISGLGVHSYSLALRALAEILSGEK